VIDRSQDASQSVGPTGLGIEGHNGVRTSRRGTHLGSGHMRPRHQTGHMSASDPVTHSLSSCRRGAVHIWGPVVPGGAPLHPAHSHCTEHTTPVLRDLERRYLRRTPLADRQGGRQKVEAARNLRTGSIRCCMAGSAGEWLAARSACRDAPVGAAQGAAGPSVTARLSQSSVPTADPHQVSEGQRLK